MKTKLLIFAALLLSGYLHAQKIVGKTLDTATGKPLSFVHIGVEQQDRGTISTDLGIFRLEVAGLSPNDSVRFSTIGYETRYLTLNELQARSEVQLTPTTYGLNQFTLAVPTSTERLTLGANKPSKMTTGESGTTDFGRGWEWGLKIPYPDRPYYLETINFHTRFNTIDSALFRIHVYSVRHGLPDRPLLTEAVYTTSRKKDKWISARLLEQALLIEEDIIVTYELVRIWYGPRAKKNALFYTHASDSSLPSFYRRSSFATWEEGTRTPPALYVQGIPK